MNNKIINIRVGKEDYPTNCYIIYDEQKNGVLIDPGFDKDKIIKVIKENNINIKSIFITHCHADHIGALDEIKKYTNANVYIHENDASGIYDMEKSYFEYLGIAPQNIEENEILKLTDGQKINVGNISLEIIHTPGHTDGSICIYVDSLNALFTGDTIFHNCYGRCDLKSGSITDMGKSIEKLFTRFNDTVIYPGHEETINIDNCKRKIRLLYKIRN